MNAASRVTCARETELRPASEAPVLRGRPFLFDGGWSGLPRALLVFCVAMGLGCEAPEVIPRHEEEQPASEEEPVEAAPELSAILDEIDMRQPELLQEEVPADIALSIARLYDGAGRYPDAIDWYRRVIDAAEPGLRSFEDLIESDVEEAPRAPEECSPTGVAGSIEQALERAARLKGAGEEGPALACYRAALAPVADASRLRGEAWRAIESPSIALEHIERASRLKPDDADLLFLLGDITFEIRADLLDLELMERALSSWRRYERIGRDEERVAYVRRMLPYVETLVERRRGGAGSR